MNKNQLCMLSSVNRNENKATYQILKTNNMINLYHDEQFIDYLDEHLEDGICFVIDMQNKRIVNEEV